MNKNLENALDYVRMGRKALEQLIEEPEMNAHGVGFHSQTWEQAFIQAFDGILALKDATPRDAATLGLVYLKTIDAMINALMEMPENQLSVADLCTMTYRDLDDAERYFGYVLGEEAHG